MLLLEHAEQLADEVRLTLTPHCERIAIAGSIRRKKAAVKDIEIVCIPNKEITGLFFDEITTDPGFCEVINRWEKIKGDPTGKYTQREIPYRQYNGVYCIETSGRDSINLDIFIATPDNWGLILALRTGPADYSHHKILGAVRESGYTMSGGTLFLDGGRGPSMVITPEEKDFFKIINLEWTEPEDR